MSDLSKRSKRGGASKRTRKRGVMIMRNGNMIPHPPQLDRYEIRHSQVLRFTTNAAVGVSITFQNLLDTILLATSATAVYDLFNLVKINFVKVWSIASIGTATTVEVTYQGTTVGQIGDNDVHTDTSLGVQPGYICARPSKKSLASDFQPSTANLAFGISAPSGSVVDVSLSFRSLPGVAIIAQHVAVAATVGSYNYRGLDGLAASGTQFPPVYGGI
jgi:hypothetical protein